MSATSWFVLAALLGLVDVFTKSRLIVVWAATASVLAGIASLAGMPAVGQYAVAFCATFVGLLRLRLPALLRFNPWLKGIAPSYYERRLVGSPANIVAVEAGDPVRLEIEFLGGDRRTAFVDPDVLFEPQVGMECVVTSRMGERFLVKAPSSQHDGPSFGWKGA